MISGIKSSLVKLILAQINSAYIVLISLFCLYIIKINKWSMHIYYNSSVIVTHK
jgi:hypothetical protein